MKKIITAIIAFCLPSRFAGMLLNLLGHKIDPTAKIGFSLLFCDKIYMDKNTRIGHLNFIKIRKLLMRENAFIISKNRINGPINILMRKQAAIARSNSIYRGNAPITTGIATLKLGELAQIVSQNQIDLTKSITMGNFVTVGGHGGQFWTHGFVHSSTGAERIRVDGEIVIGNNVYIGSRCTFNPGVFVADGITIGSNSPVAKSLTEAGMYVSQPLRYLPHDFENVKNRLKKTNSSLSSPVYEKEIAFA